MPNTIRNSIVTIANYTEVRNEHIKTSENDPLRIGDEQYSPIHPDGVVDRNSPDKVNPTIGYGYNLVDKTLAQNTALFTLAFGGTLTPTMIDALQLLEIWRSKTDFTINREPVRPRTALLSSYEIFRNFCRNYCRNFFRTAKVPSLCPCCPLDANHYRVRLLLKRPSNSRLFLQRRATDSRPRQ